MQGRVANSAWLGGENGGVVNEIITQASQFRLRRCCIDCKLPNGRFRIVLLDRFDVIKSRSEKLEFKSENSAIGLHPVCRFVDALIA